MSTSSNRHQIIPFVAGDSKPFTGQRLAKIGYKASKNQPAKFASVCASVPTFQELSDEQLRQMMPHVISVLESAQDGIIRSLYESSGGQLNGVSDEEISFDACFAFLESESNGGRLTKEFLDSWFNTQIRDNLTVILAEKLETENLEDTRITQHLNAYRGLISSLSGGKTLLNDNQLKNVRKALELANEEDDTHKKLIARLDAMEKKPKIEELLEL